ncbi:MAG: hypothetical protein K0S00_1908 [Xanthobacteraceae bacterium]|jgi:type II secretory pathway pseudopilin PulG|nr:hypothetical protein [Xanthobacteraceae bacterium]
MQAWIGPAVVAAVISSLVTVIGWWLNHQRERRRDAARRLERIRDVQAALRAEIRSHRERLRLFELNEDNAALLARIEASNDTAPFTPFLPREVDSFVFDAVIGEIHILPVAVIDDVVVYYRQTRSIAQFADDLRSDRFDRLQPERKAQMYRDYLALGRHAALLADRAIAAIDRALDGRINSPASAPSDRKSASGSERDEDGNS